MLENDFELLKASAKAMRNKRHNDAYTVGMYNFIAFSTVLSNAFSKDGGNKYPDRPLYLLEEQREKFESMSDLEKDRKFREELLSWR